MLGPDDDVFARELCWREFYADVLFADPGSARRAWSPTLADLPVDTGPEADARFDAWVAGRTGYPLIDAGMRQLAAEGWMHNRVRMAVASFLVKDLHLDWRRGAAHFMRALVDGDLASNQHGWQWVAGTGTDASPYNRVFNPTLQAKRFDPDGTYIKRYVPELRDLEPPAIHEPQSPIVDHAAERLEALRRYDEARRHR
jgi:deoxyribodipyrimidine photo-lyase